MALPRARAPQLRPEWIGYLVALLGTGLCLVMRMGLTPLLGEAAPFMLFTVAVTASALAGGLGPGLFATALGAAAGAYFVLEPRHNFAVAGSADQVLLGLFLLIGGLISWMGRLSRNALGRSDADARALREEKEFAEALVRSLPGVFYLIDSHGRFVRWNDNFAQVTGYSGVEIAQMHPVDFVAPADRPAVRDRMAEVFARGASTLDAPLVAKDGRAIPYHFTGVRVERAGEPFLTGVGIDVAERVRAGEQLRLRTAQLEALLANAPLGLGYFDRDFRYLHVNRGLAEINGLPAEEHYGRTLREVVPENADALEPLLAEVFATGRTVTREVSGETPRSPGERRHWLTGFYPVFAGGPEPVCAGAFVLEVTERRRAEEAIRESEERFRVLFEAAPIGKFLIDPGDGRVLDCNRRAAEALGYARDELLRLRVADFEAQLSPEQIRANLEKIGAGQALQFETRHRTRSGATYETLITAQRIRLAGRALVYATSIDITARKRAEEALRQADRRKDEYLATLAHELRNPLAPILNAAQILQRLGPDDPALREQREVIERQARQMKRLLDDLLDVSRISRGKVLLKKEPVSLAAVLRQAAETSRPLLQAKRHTLEVNLPDDPVTVSGDPARLVQVFANLLNNAAKYTDDGGRVTLAAACEDGVAEVRVRDTGMGMDPDTLARAFDLFVQEDRALDRAQGGLGIGLALVRKLVELHGGRVEAHSAGPGRGSEFTIRLPRADCGDRAPAPAEPQPTPAAAAPPRQTGPKRILIVDDNVDAANSLAILLKMLGHATQTAHAGPAALAAAPSFRPDHVVLDIGLPGMDGHEVARALRRMPELQGAVLTAVTGYGQEEDRRRSKEAGFDHHLTKPVDFDQLQALLAG